MVVRLNNIKPMRLSLILQKTYQNLDGYGHLRSAIELLVEHEIFQGTVKRYQKNIALTQFVKVDGILVSSHKDKFNEIFERYCGFIKGHNNPTEIHNDLTIAELKIDFENFNNIRKDFVG